MDHCSCEHCYNPVVAKGLCGTHYKRFQRHGDVNQTRPNDWGKREKHPLMESWRWIKKYRGTKEIEPTWTDFWKFVEDVGDRPTDRHNLKRRDSSKGYTKENLFWKESVASTVIAKEYAREWRKANPDKAKNANLKSVHGITLKYYLKLRDSQNNSCAICKKHEDEEPLAMAVDHCHTTGKIRGLLCANCNRALGLFKDNRDFLKSAITYLGE